MRWKEHKKSFASLKEDAASLNPSDLDGMGPPVGKKRARDDSDDDDDGDNGEEEEEEEDAGNDDEDDDDEKENGSDSLPEQWYEFDFFPVFLFSLSHTNHGIAATSGTMTCILKAPMSASGLACGCNDKTNSPRR